VLKEYSTFINRMAEIPITLKRWIGGML